MRARRCWVAGAAAVAGLVLLAGPVQAADPPPAPPSTPGRVAVTTRPGTLTLTWQAATGGPVSGYRVACASTDGGPARSASPGASARSAAFPLPDNRTYSCTVAATGPGGTSRAARTPYVMHAVIGTAGGSVRMHVPMAAGQGLSAAAAGATPRAGCSGSTTLVTYAPGGRDLAAACLVSGAAFVDGRDVTTRGTGAVALEARTGLKGTAELTAWVYTDDRHPIAVAGPAVQVRTRTPGQNAELSFTVPAPRRVSVDLSGITVPGGVTISILDASGATLGFVGTSGSTGYLDTVDLPRSGTYRVLVDPGGRSTGGATVRLNGVPADSTGTLTVNGPAARVTITSPGQNGVRTFTGRAGQRVTLSATANTIPKVTLSIVQSNGATIAFFQLVGSPRGDTGQVTLPAAGTYRVVVDPDAARTGSVSVRVTS